MIYRKSPPQPPRLLLRVAGAGALAAVASMAACGSTEFPASGFVDGGGGDSSVEGCDACGLVSNPDSGGVVGSADGSVFFQEAGSDAGDEGPVGLFGNDSGSQDGGQDQ